tara:strand:- start:54 stop:344 length:291 start_codon:yes stop_codon:yes gene_type:complete
MNVEILNKLDLVLNDLKMLKDGKWEPDKSSCTATIDNIEYVIRELTVRLKPFEAKIKNNIEWLYTTTEDEVQCIGIENLEAILQEFIDTEVSISLE